MRIIEDVKLDFQDVLILPKRSTLKSRNDVVIERTYKFKHSKQELTCVGVIAANMDNVGTFEMARVLSKQKILTALHKHYEVSEIVRFYQEEPDVIKYVFYSIGMSDKDVTKLDSFIEAYGSPPVNVCIDVANGYSEGFVEFVQSIRAKLPTSTLLVGNVVTSDMAEELVLSGADIVKTGIGSGSVCTTRLVAGIGYPQLSAVIETADASHGLGGHICSDGGCTTPADVVKAFAAGADFVMLGGMLAGHDESGGEIVSKWYKTNEVICDIDGSSLGCLDVEQKTVEFYGMSSSTAMNAHSGGVAEYRSSEGRTVELPYRGPVKNTINYILGGIRSACTYTGSKTLKELPKRATFIKINNTHNRVYENVTKKLN